MKCTGRNWCSSRNNANDGKGIAAWNSSVLKIRRVCAGNLQKGGQQSKRPILRTSYSFILTFPSGGFFSLPFNLMVLTRSYPCTYFHLFGLCFNVLLVPSLFAQSKKVLKGVPLNEKILEFFSAIEPDTSSSQIDISTLEPHFDSVLLWLNATLPGPDVSSFTARESWQNGLVFIEYIETMTGRSLSGYMETPLRPVDYLFNLELVLHSLRHPDVSVDTKSLTAEGTFFFFFSPPR